MKKLIKPMRKLIPLMTVLLLVAADGMAQNTPAPPRLVSHRGGRLERDENVLGSFKTCYEKGLRGFETDFHMTADNKLLVLHDDTLDRTTDGTGTAALQSSDEIRKARSKQSGEPLPFVEDFVAYFKDKPGVFIELEMKTSNPKLYPPARLETYCRLLREAARKLPEGAYVFTSFDARVLRVMKRLYPDAPTGLITRAMDKKQIELARELGVQQIAPDMFKTTPQAVRDAKKAGFKLTGWQVQSEADYALGVALGFDNLTTDIPVRLTEGVAKPR
jgi:glycerophosphoryl diester phosphodiesterase